MDVYGWVSPKHSWGEKLKGRRIGVWSVTRKIINMYYAFRNIKKKKPQIVYKGRHNQNSLAALE